MADQELKYDLDGYEEVTAAIRTLLNKYPGLAIGDEIAFATLPETSGKAMYPISSAVIATERESITGHVTQTCVYPLHVIYRAANLTEDRRARIKEWLDNLGRWLERQTITVDDTEYKLDGYPALTGNRVITQVQRQTAAYLDSVNENKSENWVIYISAQYKNEFER